MSKKIPVTILLFLIAIIVAAAILRFYKLPERQYWMIDEERDAFIVKKMLINRHPTLIGGALPGGFYLAPGYFYISAFFYYLTNLNPVGLGYIITAINVISIPIMFLVIKKMFNINVAILASIFYTFSYLTVIYNRTWWPLALSPIVSIVSYFSLFKIIKDKNLNWLIPLTIALIVGIQSDPSSFSILTATIVIFLLFKVPFKNPKTLLAILAFFLSHIPLLIFDLRHDFLNTKAIIKFFSGGTGAGLNLDLDVLWQTLLLIPRNFSRFFWVFGDKDAALQINPGPIYIEYKYLQIPTVLLIFSSAVLLFFVIRSIKAKRKRVVDFIVAMHILISLGGIAVQNFFFGNWTYEWILSVLFPAYATVTAIFLLQLFKISKIFKFTTAIAIIVFCIFSSKTILESENIFGLQKKIDAVKFVTDNLRGQDFSLESIGTNYAQGGYRYLFYIAGFEPTKSYTDPYFAGWLYPKRRLTTHPDRIAVVVNHEPHNDSEFESKYKKYLDMTISRKSFGRIEVLIVDNSQKWVDW